MYLLIFSSILFLIAVVWLTLEAGRKETDGELHLLKFDSWKTELGAAFVILIWILGTFFFFAVGIDAISTVLDGASGMQMTHSYVESDSFIASSYVPSMYVQSLNLGETVSIFGYGVFTFACFFAGYLSLVRRMKAKSLWKNSLLKKVCGFIRRVVQNAKLTGKTVAFLLIYCLFQIFVMISADGFLILLLLLADAFIFWYVLKTIMEKDSKKLLPVI